jgi:hypothetical protein
MSASPYKTTVSVAAASRDLTVLATVKQELGIANTSQDAWLATQITQASQACATYCNRVFAQETLVDYFRLQNQAAELLFLSRFPVASVDAVVENDVTLDASQYEYEAATGFLWRLDGSDVRSRWSYAKVAVTFKGGYELLETLPPDIERACIVLVKQNYFAKVRDPMVKGSEVDIPDVRRERTDYWVGSASSDNGALPSEVQSLLDPYIVPSIG